MESDIDPRRRIDEAHGLWELAVTRVAALLEAHVSMETGIHGWLLVQASTDERTAFTNWQRVSKDCGA